MNKKIKVNLTGKILEIIKRQNKSLVRISCDTFMLDLPCPENCDFRLEDYVVFSSEIIINQIITREEFNQQSKNKMEVQDER